MAEMTYDQARELLDALPEYHWLTRNDQPWWSATEVARGLGVHVRVVTGWLDTKQIPGAIEYPGKWSIPRSTLLVFLAKRHQSSLPESE